MAGPRKLAGHVGVTALPIPLRPRAGRLVGQQTLILAAAVRRVSWGTAVEGAGNGARCPARRGGGGRFVVRTRHHRPPQRLRDRRLLTMARATVPSRPVGWVGTPVLVRGPLPRQTRGPRRRRGARHWKRALRAGRALPCQRGALVPAGDLRPLAADPPDSWQIMSQWYSNYGGSPPLALFHDRGLPLRWSLRHGDSSRTYWRSRDLERDEWHEIVVGVFLSQSPSRGWVEVWLDGKRQTLENGRLGCTARPAARRGVVQNRHIPVPELDRQERRIRGRLLRRPKPRVRDGIDLARANRSQRGRPKGEPTLFG